MRKFDTVSLLMHARNGMRSALQDLEDSGESVMSFVVLHLHHDTAEVPDDLLVHVNRLIDFKHNPEKWNVKSLTGTK